MTILVARILPTSVMAKEETMQQNSEIISDTQELEENINLGKDSETITTEQQETIVENEMKVLKITTQVIKNNGIYGGNITGERISDEENNTENVEDEAKDILYVEEVKYGEDATKEIIITPEENYAIDYITINEKEYEDFTENPDGTVTIPLFKNVTEDIHIKVQFSDNLSNIEINHYLWKGSIETSTEKVSESEMKSGKIGDEYTTLPLTDIDYDQITNKDYYGEENIPKGKNADDLYIPENYKGTYKKDENQQINYYYKEKTYTLTVHHYIEGTQEKVPLKNGKEGQTVDDVIIENLKQGEDYTTQKATEEQVDYTTYELVRAPEQATGVIEEDTEVIYEYEAIEQTTGFTITKVAEENHKITIKDTHFALYRWIGENNSTDEIIDKSEPDLTKWELIGNYVSSSSGIIEFENLSVGEEYRLVETKAAEGRQITDGQWEIQLMDENYDQTDTSIKIIDGVPLKITAIGNPPAFAIEEGNLLIPNKQSLDFPETGAFGANIFYQIGILIIATGLITLVFRKINL